MASYQRSQKEGRDALQVARILLDEGAVSINTAQPFVYASGITSPIYCDLRLLTASPERRERVVQAMVDLISEVCDLSLVSVVAGVATAGISWAAWVSSTLNKPMAYVRDAPKGHGKSQQVEGGVVPGQTAIVIEDLTSMGGSAINAVEALRAIGARVGHCFSIFTYELPQARDGFHSAGVELHSLCGIATLLEVATASGQVTDEEVRAVREWLHEGPMAGSRAGQRNP